MNGKPANKIIPSYLHLSLVDKLCTEHSGNNILVKYGWQRFVENLPDGFQITDLDTHQILYINPAGAKIYGCYDPNEITGSKIDSLINFKNYKHIQDRINQLKENKSLPTAIHEITGMDGIDRFIEIDSQPITIEGELLVQTVLRDVTKREKIRRKILSTTKEKEVLLQEVHHRVKNNLAIISSLITLYELDADQRDMGATLQELQSRIQTFASIHEVIYQTQDFTCVDVIECLFKFNENLVFQSNEIFNNIKMESNERVYININEAMTLFQLIAELLLQHTNMGIKLTSIAISTEKIESDISIRLFLNAPNFSKYSTPQKDSIGSALLSTYEDQLGATIVRKKLSKEQVMITISFIGNNQAKGSSTSMHLCDLEIASEKLTSD